MTAPDLRVGDTVRVISDVVTIFGQRVGIIDYIDGQRARVRFSSDDEFTYWFRPEQLVPASLVGKR